MILIDMPMPKRCEWLDDNHNLKSCPLLGDEDNCKLQDCKEFRTWEDQYVGCPLHEVTADEDTISRKQAIEPFMDNSDDWVSYDVRKILESLPPSPNAPKTLDTDTQHAQGVESVGDDTVSRQAVRDAVCEELDSIDHVPQLVYDRLTKKIENLPPSPTPTVMPKPQWIPCSDPSEIPKDKMLWATHDNGYERYVEILFFDMTEWSDRVSDVVAYMPYYEPQPYKGVDA